MQDIIQKTIHNLEKNNMVGYYADSIATLQDIICKLLTPNETIGCADSVTLEETGIFEMIRSGEYHFLDKHKKGLSREEKREIYLDNFRVDTFLTGTNAVTMQGELFNIDGNGSRVAPILYGPKQVIIVVGTNKVVKTIDEAIKRTRQIAAPLDAKRLGKDTPCTKLDQCVDCRHKQRICNDFVLITGQFQKDRIKVILVEGEYGF